MTLPRISVVTITYGHERYILDCIKGVLSQQYEGEIEFIIANDNSPDNTHEIVNSFLKSIKIPQNISVKYFKHITNKGMLSNFVWALSKANAEYVAICEGDDFWVDKYKLSKQIDVFKNNDNIAICFHKVSLKYENTLSPFLSDINIKTKKVSNLYDITKENFIHTVSCIFKNPFELPRWYIENDIYPPDWFLHILNACNGDIFYINEEMATYRIHEGGVHSTKKINIKKFVHSLREMKNHLKSNKRYEAMNNINNIIKNTLKYQFIVQGLDEEGEKLTSFQRALAFITKGSIKYKLLFLLPIILDEEKLDKILFSKNS